MNECESLSKVWRPEAELEKRFSKVCEIQNRLQHLALFIMIHIIIYIIMIHIKGLQDPKSSRATCFMYTRRESSIYDDT